MTDFPWCNTLAIIVHCYYVNSMFWFAIEYPIILSSFTVCLLLFSKKLLLFFCLFQIWTKTERSTSTHPYYSCIPTREASENQWGESIWDNCKTTCNRCRTTNKKNTNNCSTTTGTKTGTGKCT